MRMRLGQNIVRRARRDEFLQHLASQEARILHPAIELAVGKSPRPALAELDIAVGIQLGPAPQAPCILGPLPHHLAPVQDDRAEAHPDRKSVGKGQRVSLLYELVGWRYI